MAATELLNRLRTGGLTLSPHGDQLLVTPRDRLTGELRQVIKQSKAELLAALAADLESRIQLMAQRWHYSSQESAEEMAFAAARPDASLRWIERDEAQWIDGAFHRLGVIN